MQQRIHFGVQLALDILVINLVWLATIHARILLNPVTTQYVTNEKSGLWAPPPLLVFALWIATSIRFELYKTPEVIEPWRMITSAFANMLALGLITAVVTFFSRSFGEFISRMFVPLMLPIAFALFWVSRYASHLFIAAIDSIERTSRVAIVGDWEKGKRLFEHLEKHSPRTLRGLIVPESDLVNAQSHPTLVLGSTQQLGELINRERLDRVILLDASLPNQDLEYCSQILSRMGVPVSCAFDYVSNPVEMDVTMNFGVPLLEVVPVQFTRKQQIVKRIFDVVVSVTALVVLAPILFAIAVLIKLTSPGPILYTSLRVGKGGRLFTFIKFRSMYVNDGRRGLFSRNEKSGHIFKLRNDPRVTPLGRFLRRYSLDELPQLINILFGQMSVVGPRPLPAGDLERNGMSKEYSAWSEGRSQVPPGLTGLWQVSGRSDLPFEDMVRLDLKYVQNWSLALDIRILINTPVLVLRGAGAY